MIVRQEIVISCGLMIQADFRQLGVDVKPH